MLAKVNDNEEQAHQLGALLQGRAVVLNLIPWNPVYSPEFDFEAPGHQRTEFFQTVVRQYGVHCTVRQEKGQDISGSGYMGHGLMCTAAIHATCHTFVRVLQLLVVMGCTEGLKQLAGACGQLVVEYGAGKGCGGSTNSDMEDIASKLIGTTQTTSDSVWSRDRLQLDIAHCEV